MTAARKLEERKHQQRGFMGFCSLKERKKYEEQGILEDGDTGHRDGADGTGYYTGSDQLHVRREGRTEWVRSSLGI